MRMAREEAAQIVQKARETAAKEAQAVLQQAQAKALQIIAAARSELGDAGDAAAPLSASTRGLW